MSKTRQGDLGLDANVLYTHLLVQMKKMIQGNSRLVGIPTGGVWLAEKLHADLGMTEPLGIISSTMHRDDFSQRGLVNAMHTQLPFDVEGSHIILVDDVLHTGRTIRAVLNELFDYGRPQKVELVVMVDRDGRQLPIAAAVSCARIALPATDTLRLRRNEQGAFHFEVQKQS